MNQTPPWIIVLAAGDGTRLSEWTRDGEGRTTPKQFCSLEGGRTLLGDTLLRARRLTNPGRIVTVVAKKHRSLWGRDLRGVLRRNTLVQPANRGTALGILLPLLAVLDRDPRARVVILPSDHHVERESVLRTAVRDALDAVAGGRAGTVLLGISPDAPVPDYGWILPRPSREGLAGVERFVEKPPRPEAEDLLTRGGLWNSFLLAAEGRELLTLCRLRLPAEIRALRRAGPGWGEERTLAGVYADLPTHDFSRDVLQGNEGALHVLPVPPCGWTDLGTPGRVVQCLRSRRSSTPPRRPSRAGRPVLAALASTAP